MADDGLVRLAREALLEITPEATVGEVLEQSTAEDGVVTLTFATTMQGYPGWHWTVSIAQLPGEEPTVLEAELLPGEGALLAPDWVPWSERLEEYRAAQAAAAAEAGAEDADDDGDESDDDADEDDDSDSDDDDDDDDDDSDDDDDDGDDDADDADDFDPDDDFGDDPDDGIDFESDASGAAAEVHVDEADEPDADADEAGPQPPHAAGLDERSDEEE
ncbi:DUF3027 domain-containing protein [Protaetiibacter sp. SSC-01]|uniref:DUF3027 domain-containing protein n=1 Tax=Protaetiibacter sp. SSC-01 TaxID=2759943 RepID=UPI001656D923|nr:DUF3027 domain-containing protein [Protaetiibacter sp. SSC-01]QNO37979.1 DUF3027 domain-containing protein [Protaetiibacter sp. SSC-01]